MSDIISKQDEVAAKQTELDNQLGDAVKRKDYTAMNIALQAGANVNAANHRGASLLLQATQSKEEQMAKFLLANGADPAIADMQGVSPMIVASRNGSLALVKDLLAHGGDANAKDKNGSSALMESILGDHTDVAVHLIKNHAKVDQLSRMGSQALLFAAERKNLPVIEALLAAGADANCRDQYQLTPLIAVSWGAFDSKSEAGKEQAAIAQQKAKAQKKDAGDAPDTPAMLCAQALIAAGADVNAKGRSGLTALANASTTGVWALCHLLIDKGADVNVHSVEGPQGGYSPLMMAIAAKKPDLTDKILSRNGDINYKNSQKLRAVDMAIDHLAGVLLNPKATEERKLAARANFMSLIQAGGALDAQTPGEGLGIVHVAAVAGDMELLKMALGDAKAARVAAKGGQTALHLAIQFRKEKVVDALLASDTTDTNARDKEGHTPLHTLSFNPVPRALKEILDATPGARRAALIEKIHASSRSIATKLLARGANINAVDNEGWTPLLEAVRQNSMGDAGPDVKYIDFLLENGSDVTMRNKSSDHAALLAAKVGRIDLLEKFFARLEETGNQKMIKNFIVDSAWTAPEHYSMMDSYAKRSNGPRTRALTSTPWMTMGKKRSSSPRPPTPRN